MAEKPRVKAPKQRTSSSADRSSRRPAIVAAVALAGLVAGAVVVFALVGLGGGGGANEDEVRTTLEAAGCTLQVADALPGEHSVADPAGTSDEWNTDPPTTGPHYPIAAIFGIYDEQLEQARVIHNLEHGGVFIQYGPDLPEATVNELKAFYERHKTGTIVAPYEKLGDEFALGAWVAEAESGNGYLAKCKTFDEGAASAFLDAFLFRGPERFDPADLRPGH